MATREGRAIKLKDVELLLDCGYRSARAIISSLEIKGFLTPNGGKKERVHSWALTINSKPSL
jgi:hypothetical protein